MSKELFMEQRAYEAALSTGQITKKAVKAKVEEVKTAIELGIISPKITLIQAKVLKDFADEVYSIARDKMDNLDLSDLPDNFASVKLSERAGYESLDFEKDPICAALMKTLEERKEVLKAAYKHSRNFGGVMATEEGEEIPVLPVKSVTKSSIIINY